MNNLKQKGRVELYIPLCFLLIVLNDERPIAAEKLYIPLCFLLISYPPSTSISGAGTLHSTMFSINLKIIVIMDDMIKVFTFHYVFY